MLRILHHTSPKRQRVFNLRRFRKIIRWRFGLVLTHVTLHSHPVLTQHQNAQASEAFLWRGQLAPVTVRPLRLEATATIKQLIAIRARRASFDVADFAQYEPEAPASD